MNQSVIDESMEVETICQVVTIVCFSVHDVMGRSVGDYTDW